MIFAISAVLLNNSAIIWFRSMAQNPFEGIQLGLLLDTPTNCGHEAR